MRTIVLLTFLCVIGSAFSTLHRKQLAGPASEFSLHVLPTPSQTSTEERSSFIQVFFTPKSPSAQMSTVGFTDTIYVDADGVFGMSASSPIQSQLTLTLKDQAGNNIDLTPYQSNGYFPIGLDKDVPTVNYVFPEGTLAKGAYTLEWTSNQEWCQEKRKKLSENPNPHGALIIFNESNLRLHSYLSTFQNELNMPIGLITLVSEHSKKELGRLPDALKDTITKAVMEIDMPDGTELDIPMHDDGLHLDGAANDGIFGAQMPASEAGIYRAQAIVEGVKTDGTKFMRSTQHLINVVDYDLNLDGTAFGEMKDQERMTIALGVAVPAAKDGTTAEPTAADLRAYAEVWGQDSNGNDVAVCWIETLANVENFQNENVVLLELNMKWVVLANAVAPFVLKNVHLVDATTHAVLSEIAQIPLKTSDLFFDQILKGPVMQEFSKKKEISDEMRHGKWPLGFWEKNSTASEGALILVHGYCAGVNPWEVRKSDFSGKVLFFLNANSNSATADFAKLVDQFAEQNGATEYSVIGHSQGGLVGAHLHNFYFTGMDRMKEKIKNQKKQSNVMVGNKLIQSVGSPYLGCTGAGSSANLIKIFGVGCGSNSDLTTSGAQLWLAGISQESRQQVSYYTSTYKQGNFFGDHCNMAVNLVLQWPNDGVSELEYTVLPNGNNMGNTQKECHTTDMKYAAQYLNAARNVKMNNEAAR